MTVLTIIDTTSIQNYIFGSNRLRENIGASALVAAATDEWPSLILARKPQLGGKRLYSGGGNVVLLFDTMNNAKEFARHYSRQLIEDAPGLEAAVIHYEIGAEQKAGADEPQEDFKTALPRAMEALGKRKASRPLSAPLNGLSVTVDCESTSLPTTGFDSLYLKQVAKNQRRYRAISSPIEAKVNRSHQEKTRNNLEDLLPAFHPDEADFRCWYDIDAGDPELGKESEGSYLAVVHADGNNMGLRFEALTKMARDGAHAQQLLADLSKMVDSAGRCAIQKLGDLLVRATPPPYTRLAGKISLPLDEGQSTRIMPFRPLVYGGDDVTFICDGRLGLTLAAHYLDFFEKEMEERLNETEIQSLLPEELKSVHACAGIAVVKTHYPFARAYKLAEALCKNAKLFVHRAVTDEDIQNTTNKHDFSAMDWHFAGGGLYGSIATIREREYKGAQGDLTMRPIRLQDTDTEWRTWSKFTNAVTEFQTGRAWHNKHNKVMGLRNALRQGGAGLEEFMRTYELDSLPEVYSGSGHSTLHKDGWYGKRCGYFDVIEAMDFYLPLK